MKNFRFCNRVKNLAAPLALSLATMFALHGTSVFATHATAATASASAESGGTSVREALSEAKNFLIAKELSETAQRQNMHSIRGMLVRKVAQITPAQLAKIKASNPKEYKTLVYAIVANEFFRRVEPKTMLDLQKKRFQDKTLTEQFFTFIEDFAKRSPKTKGMVLAYLGTLRNKNGSVQVLHVPDWEERIKKITHIKEPPKRTPKTAARQTTKRR
ncbi:MAG: hypothetical protein LBR07_08910 [Puniceicoccales bacterium]|jgi:hypothetical protein|nr:hypothetical protein [Puniceicoccales bacterium]